jgi:hypothetical protein
MILFTVEAEADIIFSKEINSIAADTVKFIPPIGDFVFLSFFFCDKYDEMFCCCSNSFDVKSLCNASTSETGVLPPKN